MYACWEPQTLSADASSRVLRDLGREESHLLHADCEKLDENTFRGLIKQRKPIIFKGYGSSFDCCRKWKCMEYIRACALFEGDTLPHRQYLGFCGTGLGLTSGSSKKNKMSLYEFLEGNSNYLLGIHGDGSFCPVQPSSRDPVNCLPPLSRDLPREIQLLRWFEEYFGRPVDHQQFFAAKTYAYTEMHYDSYHNFYFACSGSRKWTMAPPGASQWLQSKSGTFSNKSQVVPHLQKFEGCPLMQNFPFITAELQSGDVLYVPSFWWHLVESVPDLNGMSIAFNFMFSEPVDSAFAYFSTTNNIIQKRVQKRRHILKLTRKSRKREFTDVDVMLEPRTRGKLPIISSTQKYVHWSEIEEQFLQSRLNERWGDWEGILREGSGVFHASRTSRTLLEKVRRVYKSSLRRKPSDLSLGVWSCTIISHDHT